MEAVDEVAAATLRAPAAVSTEVADPDALTDPPGRDPLPDSVGAPDRLVPGNAGEFGVGQDPLDREGVRVADATGLHADSDLTGKWIDERTLRDL